MEDDDTPNKYDQNVDIGDDELNFQDIKLDPETLLVQCLYKMQSALMNPDLRAGLLQFRLLAEHAEMLARAMNRLDSEYQANLDAYKLTDDYLSATEESIKSARLANKKAELLLTGYLRYRPTTAPLSLK